MPRPPRASATTADFRAFGFAQFLSSAVAAGVPPFVLVAADGGRKSWRSTDDDDVDDPQRMLIEEVPRWFGGRHFDFTRLATWGWSMGGHGALLLAEALGDDLRAAAAFSPAIPAAANGEGVTLDGRPRDVWAAKDDVDGARTGLWCGTADALYPTVRRFAEALRTPPAVASWGKGDHTRGYWDRVTPEAFRFVGERLAR